MKPLESGRTLRAVASTAAVIDYVIHYDETPNAGGVDAWTALDGQLPNTITTLYTVTAGKQSVVGDIEMVNTSGANVQVSWYIGTRRIYNCTIPANGSAEYGRDGWHVYDSAGVRQYVGSTGPTGSAGAQGAQGAQGATGATGAAGVVQTVSNVDGTLVPDTGNTSTDVRIKRAALTGVVSVPAGSNVSAFGNDTIFPGQASHAYAAGLMFYDTANDCFTAYNSDSNVALNIGQEFWIKARNQTGSTITQGQVVYINGAGSNFPTIALAKADAIITSQVAAVATENITTGTNGFVTTVGLVHTLDTSAFSAGAQLYLSATTAGALTATAPTGTNYPIAIATVVTVSASVGVILVNPALYVQLSSQTSMGLMSAVDKKKTDNMWIDVTANTIANGICVGDDSTINDTAIAAILAAAPTGATIYFPSGTYRFSNKIDINVDKRLQFKGAGRYISIIKTTSATNPIFHKSIAGWYDSWSDLGFQSSVTRTAGAAILVDQGNNIGMNVYSCWFTGMFIAIDYSGAQGGNLSVLFDLDISGVTNGGRGIRINGSTINIQIHQTTINAGAATTSACVEINQSGAVQVTNFDWIQGTNVILFNSTGGAGPQACYFTNGFCDQPQGSVIKFMGGNTANRIKFTEVGIAPTGNNHAVEIAGTGAAAVGNPTSLPGGLSFVDCDIYNAGGTGTGAGILVNGCQDINIQNSRITGFNGTGGAGVRVIPSSSNQTKVRINGCIFGPNSNLTPTNATHIDIQAGSSGLGALSISDNQLDGASVAPLADASANVVGVTKRISQNSGLIAGTGPMQLLSSAAAGVINARGAVTSGTGVTHLFGAKIPKNSVLAGQTFQVRLSGQSSSTGTLIFHFRAGSACTTADAAIWTMTTSAAQVANQYAHIDGIITIVSVGNPGSVAGSARAIVHLTILGETVAAEVLAAPNMTADWYLSVSATCSVGTFTVREGAIEAL